MTKDAGSVNIDIDELRRSVGRTVVQEDVVQPVPMRGMAVTFNAHRIHYDRDFAMRVEGLPGVVVHGMFTAQCLIDLARDRLGAQRPVTGFSFRALAPLFEGQPIRLFGRHHAQEQRVDLWAVSPTGAVATKAHVLHG